MPWSIGVGPQEINVECSKGLEQKRTGDNGTKRPATKSPRSPRHAELQDEFQRRKLRSKESQVWQLQCAFVCRQQMTDGGTFWNMWHHWNDGMMGWLNISLMPCKQISVLRGPWHTTLQLPGPKLPWFNEAQPCYEESGILLIRICKMCVYTYIFFWIHVLFISYSLQCLNGFASYFLKTWNMSEDFTCI